MMNEQKYRSKYPDIARLLHKTAMSYAEIGRRFGVTRQYIHWLNKRLGKFGRPIVVENAEEVYREIRVENTLVNEKGEEVGLKPGAPVEVTIEANPKDTVKKEKSAGT